MPETAPRPIVAVIGPTAAGKTDLAIALARRLPGGGECVCADSMQVYRGMDIGTAKPDAEARATVPHHLLDVADPADPTGEGFSVDRWHELALAAIEDVRHRGRWPVIVGGTNLYIQTLLYGLLDGPAPDPGLRARLHDLDRDALRAWLERVDPAAAVRIHPNDRKRSIRAIEVHERTGRPLSEMQTHWEGGRPRSDVILVGIEHDVEGINRRINARARRMIEAGLVEETRRLLASGLGRQAREALGYKQVIEHLEGEGSLDEAVEQIKIRTRRFAKQQRTWLRRFAAEAGGIWIRADASHAQNTENEALAAIIARWRGEGASADEELKGETPSRESG